MAVQGNSDRIESSPQQEFCGRMGWVAIRKKRTQSGVQVLGADSQVMLERAARYVFAYLDGLHDGLRGTPWERAKSQVSNARNSPIRGIVQPDGERWFRA